MGPAMAAADSGLYRLNDRRLDRRAGLGGIREDDDGLRRAVVGMKTQRETGLGRVGLATPCRKALESLDEHWEGLTRFVDDPRDPDG